MSNETTFPGLIRDYAEAGRIDLIITLCEAMKDQRDRAERRIDILTHNIAKLNESFRNITEPATGKKLTEPSADRVGQKSEPRSGERKVTSPTNSRPAPKPKPSIDTSDFQF
jgi:hypothetical protein